ncbi:hypothetical protein J6590_015756 [Homalodisca vitripennis]|nr:hypothetical protein J6590_015756 [Homalodisca vitripennis]
MNYNTQFRMRKGGTQCKDPENNPCDFHRSLGSVRPARCHTGGDMICALPPRQAARTGELAAEGEPAREGCVTDQGCC